MGARDWNARLPSTYRLFIMQAQDAKYSFESRDRFPFLCRHAKRGYGGLFRGQTRESRRTPHATHGDFIWYSYWNVVGLTVVLLLSGKFERERQSPPTVCLLIP